MRTLLLFTILLSNYCTSQVNMSANTRADIFEINNLLKSENNLDLIKSRFAVNSINGSEYVSFIAKKSSAFNRDELEGDGIMIGATMAEFVSVRYPLTQLNEILINNNFSQIHLSDRIQPLLNKVPADVRADSVWAGYGLPEGYSGKDVLIGITDWGFDYTHPMFYDTLLQNSRILAAWDQYKTSGPAPSGYSYGTEYDTPSELLTAQSDTANIYSFATHGSHCAGIAAGSGGGTEYRGIAFESQFLFSTFLIDETAVFDSFDWMQAKAMAEGKRLVISMSWGLYHMGTLDGTSMLSQIIDMLSDQGVVFVSSGGNNGDVNFHLEKDFNNDTLQSQIQFYYSAGQQSLWGQSIHMWGEPASTFQGGIQVYNSSNVLIAESPYYSTSTTTFVDSFVVAGTDTIWYNISADASHPDNGRSQMRLRVKYMPPQVKVILKSTANTGTVHYWNLTELTNGVGNWGMPFSSLSGTNFATGNNTHGIGEPTCANSCITVAAYSSEFYTPGGTLVGGQEAGFSSLGPLMNDTLKPDISAPGVQVASSISSFTDNGFNEIASVHFNGRDYPFARFSGTSMAGPVVAGVVALILDANPYLSYSQIKDILKQTARTDQHTGTIPPHSTKWGWGKVNAYAAIKMALNTTGTIELKSSPTWSIYPNPATDIIHLSGLDHNMQSITLVSLLGEQIEVTIDQPTINIEALSAGTYYIRIIRNNRVEQRKFVKH